MITGTLESLTLYTALRFDIGRRATAWLARGIGNVDEGAGWALATRPRAFFVGDGT